MSRMEIEIDYFLKWLHVHYRPDQMGVKEKLEYLWSTAQSKLTDKKQMSQTKTEREPVEYWLITVQDFNRSRTETIAISKPPGRWVIDSVKEGAYSFTLLNSVKITKDVYEELKEIIE